MTTRSLKTTGTDHKKNQQTLYPYSGPNAAKQDEEIYLLGTNSVPTVRMNSLL